MIKKGTEKGKGKDCYPEFREELAEMDLNQFKKFILNGLDDGESVSLEITITKQQFDAPKLGIWAYSYDKGCGQHIKRFSQINLERTQAEKERIMYEELKKKFESKE